MPAGSAERQTTSAKRADTSIATYRSRRNFSRSPEPAPSPAADRMGRAFVVQEHHASRLHWDFRLQDGDVLWSWAVPKGPSAKVGEKRLAVRTEDHPLAYASFEGAIPKREYGAGTVTCWDRGVWHPAGDARQGLSDGELKFRLEGARLDGAYVLVRMKPKTAERAENWLLIREREAAAPPPSPPARPATPVGMPQGAVKAPVPRQPRPQLATAADQPPVGDGWLNEIKFDGYRLLAVRDGDKVKLLTRHGHDWAARLPALARELSKWDARFVIDGELVALRDDGISDFGTLQAALSSGNDAALVYQVFDLPHLDGFDLTRCRLDARKALLEARLPATNRVRYSGHVIADSGGLRRRACEMGLEGIIGKRADAPYAPGRSKTWLKLKCQGREEFLVLGRTPPAGGRVVLGALHVGYFDPEGALHYAGGVGSGFSGTDLAALDKRLGKGATAPPAGLQIAGEAIDASVRWITDPIVIEVQFTGWSGAGRLRHAVFLGVREDKEAKDVVREIADAEASRRVPGSATASVTVAKPPARRARAKPAAKPGPAAGFVVARAPRRGEEAIEGVRLSHPDRELWPGITKRDLAHYWLAVADHALPGLAARPLALLRCPDGIGSEPFFQKHAMRGQPAALRAGDTKGDPYLAIDDRAGLVACAQLSAIELHPWGATEADPDRPDQLVFDLDPGPGVAFPDVARAARDLRDALAARGLGAFCRTTGGKGLHVVVPLRPEADWTRAKAFARGFAEQIARAAPDRFVTKVAKSLRQGRILIDWLRNGRGATAVASFCPRARPGATVATPLAWGEVSAKLDPARFTIGTIPDRLRKLKRDPWDGFDAARTPLPDLARRVADA